MKHWKLLPTTGGMILAVGGYIGIANDYPQFLENYFYRSELWTGDFSSTTEYSIITGNYPDIPNEQAQIILRINSTNGSGQVHGDLITKGLCAFNPATWIFYIDSVKPNYLSLGKTRDFVISYLGNGKKIPVAEVRLKINEIYDTPNTIQGKLLSKAPNLEFPSDFVVGQGLQAFEDDVTELNDYCGQVTLDFYKAEIEKIRSQSRPDGKPSKP